MIPTKTIQLDFWRHPTDILHLVQGEADGRKVEFKITDNGAAFDLTGFIAEFAVNKPDGNVVVNSATITEAELGIVETTISSQVVTTAGNAHAELHLMKEGQLSKSFRIVTKVAPGVDIDGIAPSVSEFNALQTLIGQAETVISIADTELWPEVVANAQYFSDLAGAGRMTETVKGNADAIAALEAAVDPVTSQLADIVTYPNIYDPSTQTAETIQDNYYLSNGVPVGHNQYWITAPIPAEPLTQYVAKIAPWDAAGSTMRMAAYDANDTYLSNMSGANPFTTPANTAYIKFTCRKHVGYTLDVVNTALCVVKGATAPSVYIPYGKTLGMDLNLPAYQKKTDAFPAPYYLSKLDDDVHVVSKYDDAHDLDILMNNHMYNNLFEIASLSLIANSAQNVSSAPGTGTALLTTVTDWISPHKVFAVNNIDGDVPVNDFFTGGAHGYSNVVGSSALSATARQTGLIVKVDGRTVDSYAGYANYVDIYRVARVQASNTEKSDGSGREVVEEVVHWHFEGGKIDVEREITALESVNYRLLYGLQGVMGSTRYASGVYFKGSKAFKGIKATDSSGDCGDLYCREMLAFDDDHCMEIGLYPDGLGDFALCTEVPYSAFNRYYAASDRKLYFNPIRRATSDVLLEAGERIYHKGWYRFFPRVD